MGEQASPERYLTARADTALALLLGALRFGEQVSVTHAPNDLGVEFTLSRVLAHARF